jgi:DNA-binding CsgD family transcriptional regulator
MSGRVRPGLCPVLVGRDAELRQLTALLDKAAGGTGGLACLSGEAGIGKSRLAREVMDLGSARGFAVFTGRASDSAAPIPLRPIAEVLMRAARDGLHADLERLADYRPALGSLVPEWRRAGDGGAEVSEIIVAEGVLRLISTAGDRGALLVLEDLQWADPQTLTVVEYLADNIGHAPVLCLATVRDSEPSAGLDLTGSLVSRRAAGLIRVPRLPEHAIRQMAAECLGVTEVPARLAGLLRDCDGLPFAVEEMLAAAGADAPGQETAGWAEGSAPAAGVPGSIANSVARRLTEMGDPDGDVLAWAAVLGRCFDPALLPALADMTEDAVLAALLHARQAMLIEPADDDKRVLRFRHNLTRRAIVARLLPQDRAARSARAAAAIEEAHPGLPGAWCELAADLRDGAGDCGGAAALMLASGRRALARGAVRSAVALLDAARERADRAPDTDAKAGLDIDDTLFRALALAGDYGRLAEVAGRLAAGLDRAEAGPRRQARTMIATARVLHADDMAAAWAQLALGSQIARQLHAAELVSRAELEMARCAADGKSPAQAIELAGRSLAGAESAGLTGWAAEVGVRALQVIGSQELMRDVDAAQSALVRAYQIARGNHCTFEGIDVLHDLGTIELLEGGTGRRLEKASELAHAGGAISLAVLIDLRLAILQAVAGNPGRGHATARRCEQDADRIKAPRLQALAVTMQAFASAITADPQAAELAASRAETLLPDNPEILFTTHGLVRVTAALFADDLPGALRHSITAASCADQVSPRTPRMAWALYPLLQAVSDGDGLAALDQARATSAAVKWNRGFFAYTQAVMAGRAGQRRQAAALTSQGEALLAPFAPVWNHLGRRLIADSALRHGWGEPARWLREAAREFDASGHNRLAGACRNQLRRIGQPVPTPRRARASMPDHLRRLGITSREMDVYQLLGQGLSNDDIARQLSLSAKTIDTHVASLIAKTGLTARRELIAHAARHSRRPREPLDLPAVRQDRLASQSSGRVLPDLTK